MQNLQMNIRTVGGEKQVNCAGYFQSDWFGIDELLSKQTTIYDFIKELESNNQDTRDMVEHYDVTEHMRVKLLKSK